MHFAFAGFFWIIICGGMLYLFEKIKHPLFFHSKKNGMHNRSVQVKKSNEILAP